MEELEAYHKVFASVYPERTLDLFKKVLVPYVDNNTGRSCYEQVLSILRMMSRISGGKKLALEMVNEFRAHYKNRSAMIEILGRFK